MTATIPAQGPSRPPDRSKALPDRLIAADPTDATTRAVFADWLEEHGVSLDGLLTRELKREARRECGESRTSNIDVSVDLRRRDQ
jgi:uncharacterized protein (TIGR02996 family)